MSVGLLRTRPQAARIVSICDTWTDTVMMQSAMEPEAVASGLVAGEDHSALRNAEPGFGASDLPQDGRGIPGLHRHNTSPLATGSGRGQLPLTGAQLESNVGTGANEAVELRL